MMSNASEYSNNTISYAIAYEGCKPTTMVATRPVVYVGPDGFLRKRTSYTDSKTQHTKEDIEYLAGQGFITMFDEPLRLYDSAQGCVIINREIVKNTYFPPVQLCSLSRVNSIREEIFTHFLKQSQYLLSVGDAEKAETMAWHVVNATTTSNWALDSLAFVAAARILQSKEETLPALHEYWVQGIYDVTYEEFVDIAESNLVTLGYTLNKE